MGSNGYENAQRFVDEYERHEREKQQIMMEAATKVANGPGKFMKEVTARAKEAGIGTKIFKAALLERKHLNNAAKVRDKLDEEFQNELEIMRKSLAPVADLPIFGAAIEAAEQAHENKKAKAKQRRAAVDSLTNDNSDEDVRPRFMKGEDGKSDIERLADGIKPLSN